MRPLYRAGQRDTCTVRSQPEHHLKMENLQYQNENHLVYHKF